jgi:predicted PurR-regulated permease PerM
MFLSMFEINRQDAQRFWMIVFVIIALVLVYFLSPVIIPFALAIILAYILNPLVARLKRVGVPRWLSITVLFFIGLVAVILLLSLLVPIFEKQILNLINNVPKVLTWLQSKTALQLDPNMLKQALMQHLQAGGSIFHSVWTAFMRSSRVLIETVISLVIIPIVAIYLLRDWDKVTQNLIDLLPRQHREKTIAMVRECGEVLAAFFRGQLLVMIGLAIVYSIGLAIVGLDLWLVIGISAGLLSVVPYLGFIIGFIVSIADVLIKYPSWLPILYVCIVFAIGHIAESYILQPWLVGNRIGLHPVAVIFAVIAGGVLYGFVGVLLALPVAAVIKVILRRLHNHYIHTSHDTEKVEDKSA